MTYVTIRDVAERAGVSAAAVSQILNGKGRFSKKTREFVFDLVEKMGYIPDSRARAMRSGDAKTVGLLVPDLRNAYFADMVASMEEELYERGFSTLIGSFGEDVKRQDSFLHSIMGQRIDGAIVVPKGVPSPGVNDVVKRRLPLVFVDRRVPDAPTVPYIVSDPTQGIKGALGALIACGHRKIGFVSHSSLSSSTLFERESQFKKLTDFMLDRHDCLVVDCSNSYKSHVKGLDTMLRHGITAIIFGYSPDAITMIGLMQKKGMLIGSDISVVSFDDIEVFGLMTPQISVISQQAQEMGRRGVEEVLELIQHNNAVDESEKIDGFSNDSLKAGIGKHDDFETSQDVSKHMVRIPTLFIARDSVGPLRSEPK